MIFTMTSHGRRADSQRTSDVENASISRWRRVMQGSEVNEFCFEPYGGNSTASLDGWRGRLQSLTTTLKSTWYRFTAFVNHHHDNADVFEGLHIGIRNL